MGLNFLAGKSAGTRGGCFPPGSTALGNAASNTGGLDLGVVGADDPAVLGDGKERAIRVVLDAAAEAVSAPAEDGDEFSFGHPTTSLFSISQLRRWVTSSWSVPVKSWSGVTSLKPRAENISYDPNNSFAT